MASMFMKSEAGLTRWNTIVIGFGVEMPGMLCVFWYLVMLAAVGAGAPLALK